MRNYVGICNKKITKLILHCMFFLIRYSLSYYAIRNKNLVKLSQIIYDIIGINLPKYLTRYKLDCKRRRANYFIYFFRKYKNYENPIKIGFLAMVEMHIF